MLKILSCIVLLVAVLSAGCNLNARPRSGGNVSETEEATEPASASEAAAVPSSTPTIIVIPPRPSNSPAPTSQPLPTLPGGCVPPSGWYAYRVMPGDTLSRIARQSGSTVSELIRANCIANPDSLFAGTTIYVPNQMGPTPAPPTPTLSPTPTTPIQFYLIIPNDRGASGIPVGCDDSATAVDTQRARSGRVREDVRTALGELFLLREENYGQSGFVNALYGSPLSVQEVTFSGNTVTVNIAGTLNLTGVCADARMQAQIVHTIFQFTGFESARINVGGRNMKQLFDGSGLVPDDAVYTRAEVGLSNEG